MIKLKPKHIVLLLLVLLSACSQQPQIDSQQQQTSEPIPNQWAITAKLGIRTQTDSGSVTLKWQQQQNHYQIHLSGPLGQGSGKITGNNHQITIEQANKPTVYSSNPEQLIADTFGWSLPLQHLNYWLRGLPSPYLAQADQQFTSTGTLQQLTQSGWTLSYDRYNSIDNWLMPGRVKAQKNNIKLTLVIKRWRFPTTI